MRRGGDERIGSRNHGPRDGAVRLKESTGHGALPVLLPSVNRGRTVQVAGNDAQSRRYFRWSGDWAGATAPG